MTVEPADPRGLHRLPRRPALQPGEALDSYLEQVAAANYLPTSELITSITRATGTTRFLMLVPSDSTVRALASLTGQSADDLRNATLHHYDGNALDLTGLDPFRPTSYRTVAGRGWLPGNGSQLCPACLEEGCGWQLAWRLPTSTVCTRHRCYLIGTCPGCRKPFRATRQGFLRPVGASLVCGNPDGVRGRHCRAALTVLVAKGADRACVERQSRYDQAMIAGATVALGSELEAGAYHRALRSLTVLMLHIATATTDRRPLPLWTNSLQQLHSHGAGERSPRWGVAPPNDTIVRSRALTTADQVLSAGDTPTAVHLLAPWAAAAPRSPSGFLGWVGDHMVPDPLTTQLVMATHAPRRRLSRTLDDAERMPPLLEGIPQVIPEELYEQFLTRMCGARPENVRTFAALCLARTHFGVDTWSRAAQALGLDPETGCKAAQTCTTAMTAAPGRFVAALTAVANHLPDRNYRICEQQVRDLGRTDEWFTAWVQENRPGTRPSSKTHVLTWLWLVTAHGHISTSPGATQPLDAQARAYYRRFAQSLTVDQLAALSRATESRA